MLMPDVVRPNVEILGVAANLVAETAEDINHDYGSLVFIGLFFLALILVGIWWLRR